MENLSDISELQVQLNEQKPLKLKKSMGENEFIDRFAHLAELEFVKYLPGLPYWTSYN